jgi:hypothetical protein
MREGWVVMIDEVNTARDVALLSATLEVTSNWAALAELGAPASLVAEAMCLDRQRIAGEDGLCWTPQFRDIESLWRMSERVGERASLAFFASNLHEQVQAGKIQDAEAAAACRMLDQAGYGRLRVSASSGLPTLHGYPRAVTTNCATPPPKTSSAAPRSRPGTTTPDAATWASGTTFAPD